MTTSANTRETLIAKIREKRSEIKKFLELTQPRYKRLINIGIIGSAVAAAAAAGPAMGGKDFSDWLTEALGLDFPVWQLLCILAALCSVAAAIAAGMSKSGETQGQITKAQLADARLEGLQTLLELEQIEVEKASSIFVQHLDDVSFL